MSPIKGYQTIKEASQRWGVSIRRVTALIDQGRIPGCVKAGGAWFIPAKAEDPRLPAGRPAWKKSK